MLMKTFLVCTVGVNQVRASCVVERKYAKLIIAFCNCNDAQSEFECSIDRRKINFNEQWARVETPRTLSAFS